CRARRPRHRAAAGRSSAARAAESPADAACGLVLGGGDRRAAVQGGRGRARTAPRRAAERDRRAVSSLVPRFPLRMRNTEIFTVAYRTEPDAIAQFLPPQLDSLAPRVIVHLYRMHDAEWFGAYGESAGHVPVGHAASG